MNYKIFILTILTFIFSCSKENFTLNEIDVTKIKSELLSKTCGEGTISANTSFGFFCPGFAESDIYKDKNEDYNFFYGFKVSDPYSPEQFLINFKIRSLNVGTYNPEYSQVKAARQNVITWDFKKIGSSQAIPSKTPKKIIVQIIESTAENVSGYYKIQLPAGEIFDGYFNKLKIQK